MENTLIIESVKRGWSSVEPVGTNFGPFNLGLRRQTIQKIELIITDKALCLGRGSPIVPGRGLRAIQGEMVAQDVEPQEPGAGRLAVAEAPGIGRELNETVAKRYSKPGELWFGEQVKP